MNSNQSIAVRIRKGLREFGDILEKGGRINRKSPCDPDSIQSKIRRFYDEIKTGQHHRYESWEHCYSYFQKAFGAGIIGQKEKDRAALQLGFYLASWGMYRGSSFLLKHSYTVHRGVVEALFDQRLSVLREAEFGSGINDKRLVPAILSAAKGVREAYRPFAPPQGSTQPTDTLVTKVILGTLGCLPACDRYVIRGLKERGLTWSRLDARFIQGIAEFSEAHLSELRAEQERIEAHGGIRYPLMKLVDMYFWQTGYDLDLRRGDSL